jgi:hypothetical protein
MTLHKITELYTEWFIVYPNITSKLRTIAMFKNCVKQNNDSNKTYRYVHDLLLYQSSFVLSVTVHELSPQNKIRI